MSCKIEKEDVKNYVKKNLPDGLDKLSLFSIANADIQNIRNFVNNTNKSFGNRELLELEPINKSTSIDKFVKLKFNDKVLRDIVKLYDAPKTELSKEDLELIKAIETEMIEKANNKNKSTSATNQNKNQNSKVPLTDNFTELIVHKEALLKKVEKKISDLRSERKDTSVKNDLKALAKEIARLLNIETKLKEEIELLAGKSEEYMFHAISEEIENLAKILSLDNNSSINDIAETRDALDFLSQFVRGIDLEGNRSKRKGLKKLNNPSYDKISSDIGELIKARQDKQSFLMRKLLEENIIYANNVEMNIDEKTKEKILYDLEHLDELKDLDLFSQALLGVGDSQRNDSILNQIAKTYLETRIAIREAQAGKWKDKLKYLISKIQGGFEFIFEKDFNGQKTGDLISPITEKYRNALKFYYNIGKVFGKSKFFLTAIQILSKKLDWHERNTFIIDPTKLKIFKDAFYDIPGNEVYYKYSDQEMADYEKTVKSINSVMFNQAVKEAMNGLQNYENEKELLLNSNSKYKAANIAKMNPYLFFEQIDKRQPISFTNDFNGKSTVIPNLKYIYFIPLKEEITIIDNNGKETYSDTGFYNKDFNEIAKDKNKLAYWETMVEVHIEYIHPTFQNLYSSKLSYAKFEETMLETMLDPNVKVLKNIGKIGKSIVSKGVFAFKQMFFEKGRYSENGDVLKPYSDNSNKEIEEIKISLKYNTNDELKALAKEYNVNISGLDKPTAITQISKAKVLSAYSTNINKSTEALINMASLQKAREDTAPVADMLLEIHKMKSKRPRSFAKFENWVQLIVKNHTMKYRDSGSFLGKNYIKNSFIEKILAWFGSIKYIKNLINEESARLLSDHEKFVLDNLKRAKKVGADVKNEGGFSIGEVKYAASKSNEEEGEIKFLRLENNVRYEMTQKEYEDAFQEHLNNQIAEMGLDLSIAGVIEGVMKVIVMSRLGNGIFGAVGGTFNRMEGKTTSLIMDATGNYWKTGNVEKASYFLMGSNMLHYADMVKEVNFTKNIKQMRIFQAFVDKMNLMQNRKNELDKSAQTSQVLSDKLETYTSIYQFTVDRPEFKNQGEINLSILMDTYIKDKDGNDIPIFDGDKGEFPAHELVDGKLTLKPEFRTLENISNWENFEVDQVNLQNNQYLLTKLKIKRAVSKTQGNYDPQDTLYINKGLIGKASMMFLKWMSEHIMARYGFGEQFDLVMGKMSPKGRYLHVFADNTVLSTAVAMAALVTVGPTVATGVIAGTVATFAGGRALRNVVFKNFFNKVYGGDQGFFNSIASLYKLLGFTEAVLKASLNYPLQMLNITGAINKYDKFKIGGKISNATKSFYPSFKNTIGKTNLSQEQINNFNAVAIEIAVVINYTIMLGIVAMLYYDDEDDEKSGRRMSYNFYHNQLSRMKNSITSFTNPIDFGKDVTRFAFLGYVVNSLELIKDILEGKDKQDVLKKFIKTTHIPNAIIKSVNTGMFKDEKAFNPNWGSEQVIENKTGIDKEVRKSIADDKEKLTNSIREKGEDLGIVGKELEDFVKKQKKIIIPTEKEEKAQNKPKKPKKPRKQVEDLTAEQKREKLEKQRKRLDKQLKDYKNNENDENDED